MRMLFTLAASAGMAVGLIAQPSAAPEFDTPPRPRPDKGYDRADPGAATLQTQIVRFSGRDWWVKSSTGRVGPGPNYFSDSTDNVWVDEAGRLHLKITKVKNRWHCAEVVSVETVGFGDYTWELDCAVDSLDRNVVLGLFTWSNTSPYANGEIDVEFARWGSRKTYLNAQFVVQPYDLDGHLLAFGFPPGHAQSTHSFLWAAEGVLFQSSVGLSPDEPPDDVIVREWPFLPAANDFWPQPSGTENARMNLWLYQGARPSDGREVEVIIRSFAFDAGISP